MINMNAKELLNILAAIIVMTIVIGFKEILALDFNKLGLSLLISIIVIAVAVFFQKFAASQLDANVEHKIWGFSQYWVRPHWRLRSEAPAGIIVPIFLSVFSLGFLKFPSLLTYETSAKKIRAARRFGFHSFAEITEWHNGLIGAAGIVSVLILSIIAYIPGFEALSKAAIFYAFANMIPFSKLNGTQIMFGSRVLYITLTLITLIFFSYAIFVL